MARTQFYRPDEAVMEGLLEEYRDQPTEIVLRLAWRAGLTRSEISELTWDMVDFDNGLLRLRDREVPLEEETAERLRRWKERCGRYGPRVAVSDRLRRPMAPQSMSRMVRQALAGAGQEEVRLQDLRWDYIRRQFALHDWPYVLRVAGISLSTYRNEIAPTLTERPAETAAEPRDEVGEEYRLWRVLQTERGTAAGIALWLTTRLGLRIGEIVRLTWDMVDFDGEQLTLPERTVPLTVTVRRVLEEERARRAPGEDPHVILTPKSRKPMDMARLTTVVRDALIRGGIENRTLLAFRRDTELEDERKRLLDYVAERGSVSRGEAVALLGVTEGQAYRRLLALAEEGTLTRVNNRYYPAGSVVRPEGQRAAILRRVAEAGPLRRQEAAELLHIGERSAARLLKRMVEEGELVLLRPSQRYAAAGAAFAPEETAG